MNPEFFATHEYRAHLIYKELAERESSREFRKILEELARHELRHHQFWAGLSEKKTFRVSFLERFWYRGMRSVFGLTFAIKLLEARERVMERHYARYLAQVTDWALKGQVRDVIREETEDEKRLLAGIREEHVAFVSSIVLGMNDGLIELTGALVGFSFALGDSRLVALSGMITGIAASMSMASSAYMQARHEAGKDARKAGVYTGVSYLGVVVLLMAPFFFITAIATALAVMGAVAFSIIVLTSFYTAVLLERDFGRQLGEMMFFSLGTAAATFVVGMLLQRFFGITIS